MQQGLPAPKGLSRASRALWSKLTSQNDFDSHELVAFERALRWFDKADALVALAEGAEGRALASTLKMATAASDCGLRFWKTLKFTTGVAARRPGRPSGDDWSPKRRALADAAVAMKVSHAG